MDMGIGSLLLLQRPIDADSPYSNAYVDQNRAVTDVASMSTFPLLRDSMVISTAPP